MISQTVLEDVVETFPFLEMPGVVHGLVRRVPGVSVSLDRAGEVLAQLQPWHDAAVRRLGFDLEKTFTAGQVHGADIAVITAESPRWSADVDGLMTNVPGLMLGIHTADCAPVYLVDPVRRGDRPIA